MLKIKRSDGVTYKSVVQYSNGTTEVVNTVYRKKLEYLRYVIRKSEKYATLNLIIQTKIQG